MRWLGLFTNKTFRKHLKLIFPHRDLFICIVSLAIFYPHFVIRIFPSAFYHPHFSIHFLSSAIFHPHFILLIFLSAIRHPPSAIRHPPSAIRHPPPSAAIRSSLYRDPTMTRWDRFARQTENMAAHMDFTAPDFALSMKKYFKAAINERDSYNGFYA